MLTQSEADQLMRMVKHFVRAPAAIAIRPGADDTYELTSSDEREKFLLDVWRGTYRLSKLKFQERARTVVVLVRLDVAGAPHTNPDGTRLPGTHLHLFKVIDPEKFTSTGDPGSTFHDFCAFCNIEGPPPVQGVIA